MRGFYYSVGVLKYISANYSRIYQEGIEIYGHGIYRYTDTNPWSIAEYKADFDTALTGIGKGKWEGKINGDFRNYGRLQKIIISDIMGDDELAGFYDIPRLRGYAYYLMKCFLNNNRGRNESANNT